MTGTQVPSWSQLEQDVVFPAWGRVLGRRAYIETVRSRELGDELVCVIDGEASGVAPQNVDFDQEIFQRAHARLQQDRRSHFMAYDPSSLAANHRYGIEVFWAHLASGYIDNDVDSITRLVVQLAVWSKKSELFDVTPLLRWALHQSFAWRHRHPDLSPLEVARVLRAIIEAFVALTENHLEAQCRAIQLVVDADPDRVLFEGDLELARRAVLATGTVGETWNEVSDLYEHIPWPYIRDTFGSYGAEASAEALACLPYRCLHEGMRLAQLCNVPIAVVARAAEISEPAFQEAAAAVFGAAELEAAAQKVASGSDVASLRDAFRASPSPETFVAWADAVGPEFVADLDTCPTIALFFIWARKQKKLIPYLATYAAHAPVRHMALTSSWTLQDIAPFLVQAKEPIAAIRVYSALALRHAARGKAQYYHLGIQAALEALNLGTAHDAFDVAERALAPVVEDHERKQIGRAVRDRIRRLRWGS